MGPEWTGRPRGHIGGDTGEGVWRRQGTMGAAQRRIADVRPLPTVLSYVALFIPIRALVSLIAGRVDHIHGHHARVAGWHDGYGGWTGVSVGRYHLEGVSISSGRRRWLDLGTDHAAFRSSNTLLISCPSSR
jgi:hypothetical protein